MNITRTLTSLMVVLAAAIGGTQGVAMAATPAKTLSPACATSRPPHWIILESALQELGRAGLSAHLLQKLFGNQRTFIDYTPADTTHTIKGAISTVPFSSEAALKQALQHGLPAGTRAVLFDIEHWSYTPPQEQRDPAKYMALAAHYVHQHHLLFIAAPAPDLTTAALPHYRGGNYPGYLKLKLAARAAQVSDVVDIQAQQLQGSRLSTYVEFVRAAVTQAQRANRHVMILAGLTTTPRHPITSGELITACNDVRGNVQGYWLNVPARPEIAIPLLRQMLSQ